MRTPLSLVLMLAMAPFLHGQERAFHAEKRPARKFAFLVGVTEYEQSDTFLELRYTVEDVKAMRTVLEGIGFAPDDIVVMASEETLSKRPEKRKILAELKKMLAQVREGDTVICMFSGHGAQYEEGQYFCPEDARADDLPGSCVSLKDVLDDLGACDARFKWLIVDACRSDPRRSFSGGIKSLNSSMGTVPEGVIALFSCGETEESFEHAALGHGVFSYFLTQGISGQAADKEGKVTFLGLSKYVMAETKSFVNEKYNNRKQTPHSRFGDGEFTDFIIYAGLPTPVEPPPVPAPGPPGMEEQLEAFGQLVDKTYNKGTFEFNHSGVTIDQDRVNIAFEGYANAEKDRINGKITFIGEDSSRERPFVVRVNTKEVIPYPGYPVIGTIDNNSLPYSTYEEFKERATGGQTRVRPSVEAVLRATYALMHDYRYIYIRFPDLDDTDKMEFYLGANTRAANLLHIKFHVPLKMGSGVAMDDVFFRVRGFQNYTDPLRSFVNYGTAALEKEFDTASRNVSSASEFDKQKAIATLEEVRRKIGAEHAKIAREQFYCDYDYSTRSLVVDEYNNQSSFTMAIPLEFDFGTANLSETADKIQFPMQGVTVNTANKAASYYGRLQLHISGSNDSIRKLVEDKNNYLVRVWFNNLRCRNNQVPVNNWGLLNIDADIQQIRIIDVRERNTDVRGSASEYDPYSHDADHTTHYDDATPQRQNLRTGGSIRETPARAY